jgi:hypothetical protein
MVDIDSLSWMSNQWVGQVGSDIVEETWSSPRASSMMGMFRWCSGTEIRFYEFLAIEVEQEDLFLRIIHFDPGLKAWEQRGKPTEFKLYELLDKKAIWEPTNQIEEKWLSYQLINDGALMSQLGIGAGLKNPTVFKFQAS